MVTIESGGSTLVELGGADDTFDIRLTGQPTANVQIAIITDGLTDVVKIGGVAVTPSSYVVIGGIVPSRMFLGNVTIGANTITRALGSDLGSFVEEGFQNGQNIRLVVNNVAYDVKITSTTDQVLTVTGAAVGGGDLPGRHRQHSPPARATGPATCRSAPVGTTYRITRTDGTGWLADGFLEGQWIRIASGPNAGEYKIAIIRGTNATKDDTLELTDADADRGSVPARSTSCGSPPR